MLSRRSFLLASAAIPFLRTEAFAAASGSLVFGLSSHPPNLDPWRHTGTAAGAVKQLIFRGLTSFGPDGQLRGELAEAVGAQWRHRLGVPSARRRVPQRRAESLPRT